MGDEHGNFAVTSIGPINEGLPVAYNSMSVDFAGEAQLIGTYQYYGDTGGPLSNMACFRVEDMNSLAKLPVYIWHAEDTERFFCFENFEYAKAKLGTELKTGVTIEIDGYKANVLEGEIFDWTLLK